MKPLRWSIKEVIDVLKSRQNNEFDGNIAVSGDRGNGKSTLILKTFLRFKNFNPHKHLVYSRDDVIRLLTTQTYGFCWDDEAINSGYKRNFQEKGQHELIKILTAYRDNYNIFASAIPNFFSLDKDLRDLYFLHLHVVERGIAVVHMPIQGRLYSQDRWDAAYNSKVEAKWSRRIQKDSNFKPPYHKLSTFRGYLYFNDITETQKKLYKELKKEKRGKVFERTKEKTKEEVFYDITYQLLIDGRLTKEGLIQAALISGRRYNSVVTNLNILLTNKGVKETVKNFLRKNDPTSIHSNVKPQLDNIIPSLPL